VKERIRQLRKKLGLTQEEFGSRLGITKSSISTMENGKSKPSDQTICFMCREFGVNETWLRTGKGDMLQSTSRQKELSAILADIAKDEPTVKNKFIHALSMLPDEAYPIIIESILLCAEQLQKEQNSLPKN